MNTPKRMLNRANQVSIITSTSPFHDYFKRLVRSLGLRFLMPDVARGIVSRSLAGPARVVGIDISSQLIAYARKRDTTKAISYEVHDLSQALPQYDV